MLPLQNCNFSISNQIDVAWTLYDIISRKLCNWDVNTCFLGGVEFWFQEHWLDL